MEGLPDKSIDLCLTDPPYGATQCKWDSVIPFEPMWEQLKRIVKDNGAICLFGSEPFSSHLRLSNIKMYKYDWVWEKTLFSNFAMVKKQPGKRHEIICVFYKKQPAYFPQMEKGKPYFDKVRNRTMGVTGNALPKKQAIINKGTRFPSSVQKFSNGNNKGFHPTQKPIPLLEYLIKTYTLEGAAVLDFTMGSGSTGLAAKRLNRKFIGIEKDKRYFEIAKKRIENDTRDSLLAWANDRIN